MMKANVGRINQQRYDVLLKKKKLKGTMSGGMDEERS